MAFIIVIVPSALLIITLMLSLNVNHFLFNKI